MSENKKLAKIIYLARRNPSIPVEEFPREWYKHARYSATFPQVASEFLQVAQCTNLRDKSIPGATETFDGVNLLTMTTFESSAALLKNEDALRALEIDERRVFDDYVKNFQVYAEEERLVDGPLRTLVLIEFVARAPDVSPEDFYALWKKRQLARYQAAGLSGTRLSLNHVVGTPPPGYAFDGVSELWLDDIAQARAFVTAAAASDGAFLDPSKGVTMMSRVTHSWPRISESKAR